MDPTSDPITPPPAPRHAPASSSSRSGWERQAIEKLLLAEVRERRAARRWRMVKSLLWMALIAALAWALLRDQLPGASSTPAEHTAMISIRGEIDGGGLNSAEFVLPALRSAMEDPSAKAVVLLINSPGGSAVQAGLVFDEIRRLRQLHDKPVYAVCEESCASAAYYMAAAADKVYVDKASIVGSIGVLMDGFGFVGTMEKLGVERRLLTAGGNKGMLDPFSPMDENQRQFAHKLLGQVHQQFINAVRQGRGTRLKESPEVFSGLFWTGAESVQLGLADELGSLDGVAREVVKAETIVDYSPKENLAERMAKRFGAAVGAGAISALQSQGLSLR